MTPTPPAVTLGELPVWKGHGTENDFVIIDDRDGRFELDTKTVAALCDRRAGIGGDGVLRVVRAELPRDTTARPVAHQPSATGHTARYFMDYRNADGSMAEMCGNGARVLARYLVHAGLVDTDSFVLATRAGDVDIRLEPDGQVTVCLGPASAIEAAPMVRVGGVGGKRSATAVAMPNPHVVVSLDSLEQLQALDLSQAPDVEPALPQGQNVEFIVRTGPRRLSLRVHERGSGETRSCGTGIAAAVIAAQGTAGPPSRAPVEPWQVDVAGGTAFVRWDGGTRVELTGPAVLVGRVELEPTWLGALTESAVS